MTNGVTIVIPCGPPGTSLRPHSWSKSNLLIPLAGKPLLAHIFGMFETLPAVCPRTFLLASPQVDEDLRAYVETNFPETRIQWLENRDIRDMVTAIQLARHLIAGPLILASPNTLIKPDLRFIRDNPTCAYAWVREVTQPEFFDNAAVDELGRIQGITPGARPTSNRKALVGFYFLPDGENVARAVQEQIKQDLPSSDPDSLAATLNRLLARGLEIRSVDVDHWQDTRTITTTLEANVYLLNNGHANFTAPFEGDGVTIIPPVYVAPDAALEGSIIGPFVSIGAKSKIAGSVIQNTIIDSNTEIQGCKIQDSIIGKRVVLHSVEGIINTGDDSMHLSNRGIDI